MTSIFRYIFRNCCLPDRSIVVPPHEGTGDTLTDTLHFIIPKEFYEKFQLIKPEDELLSVSQYMFLYQYSRHVEQLNEPGPDYERATYYFKDGYIRLLFKGWVPTKGIPKIDKEVKNIYHRLQDPRPCVIHAGVPRRKSAYNWGVIKNWSRYSAGTSSEDNVPINLFSITKPTVFNADFISGSSFSNNSPHNIKKTERLNTSQADDTTGRHVGSCVAMTSTFNTRDRRLRPKAAKGRRTRNICHYQYN